MIVYHASKMRFIEDVFNGTIADDIDNAFIAHLGRKTSLNEKDSWKNSMMHMYKVVNTPDIPEDSIIAIEYQIPLTSKRIDFIISGLDENYGSNVVIVELKQWERATITSKTGIISTRYQHGEAETTHPSYQAWSYAYMMENYNETIREKNIKISPCAFLHNYSPDNIINNSFYSDYIEKAPLFLKSGAKDLQNFIKSRVKYGAKEDIIWLIDKGKLRPSKQLADSLSSMLKGNQEFLMIDDQKVVYETALSLARESLTKGKRVLIIEGGPGTGKSVVAINLLVELTKEGLTSLYVSKNAAPRDVYATKLSGSFKKSFINNLFVGSGKFISTPENSLDALIIDEAHRLNQKSGLYSNLGDNQILEIIKTAKFSIFFIDDRQRIHIKDIGSAQTIKRYAESLNAKVATLKLSSQFRCNGSDSYLSWLDSTLQIRETANIRLSSEEYEFKVFSNPNDLFNAIKEKNRIKNSARVVAGYCWDWKSKRDSNAFDIVIDEYNFQKKWNLNSDKNLWIIGQTSIEEVGCIHTCQGLELDYIGVIVGPDIRFENNRVVTDLYKRSKQDQSIKGFKSKLKKSRAEALQEIDDIIKNTYRTLMTRGSKGCYVYFCDHALSQHFSNQLESVHIPESFRIESVVNNEVKYVDFLPLYSIKAACGYFGEGEVIEEKGWIKVEGFGKLNRNMFIVQAVGNSMEPKINDGDYCVFRANPVGSRQGKIVLVEHFDVFDPEYVGRHSIKEYYSEKSYSDDDTWRHEKIVLKPINQSYNPIYINEDDENYRVLGEFVGIVNR